MRNSNLYSGFIVITIVLSSFAYAGTPSETQKNWNADSLLYLGEFIASQKTAPKADLVTEPQGASLRPSEVVPATAMFYDGSYNHHLNAVSPSYLKTNTPVYSTRLKNITPYIINIVLSLGGVTFALAPTIISSLYVKLKRKAILLSISSGLLYTLLVISLGFIKPEIFAGSLFVSLIFLVIGQKILKNA